MVSINATIGGSEANSYVTLTEAEDYFEGRLFANDWHSATSSEKQQALLQACKDIETLKFIGTKYNDYRVGHVNYQKLEFPRRFPSIFIQCDSVLETYIGADYEPSYPYSTDANGQPYIPHEVKNAQCEQALFILAIGSDAERRSRLQAQGVRSFKIGDFSEQYKVINGRMISQKALALLDKFIDSSLSLARG